MPPDPANTTVIVGAGISVPPPSSAPEFERLRNTLLGGLGTELTPAGFGLDELSPEQVFDAIDDGRDETRESVRRQLWRACETGEPNDNHYAVAALLEAGVRVWTPNFDTLIERAAHRMLLRVDSVGPGDPLKNLGKGVLLKPHGSFPWTGDPPREPPAHGYELLFQASAVWLMDVEWIERLRADIHKKDVFLFGYRGADPDLTPALLDALEHARSVSWWEFEDRRNFQRLRRLAAGSKKIDVLPGDPSEQLQALAKTISPAVRVGRPLRNGPRTNQGLEPIKLSYLSRAQLLGQLRGAAVARRYLAKALFLDRAVNRRLLLFKLVRSIGYDRPWARVPILATISLALRSQRLSRNARLVELYATLLDSRPIRPSDERTIKRLRALPATDDTALAVRVASIRKLHGELEPALQEGEGALAELATLRRPALEAMCVYNLAWLLRQLGEFGRRRNLIAPYEDRMPHIGFNWAAWLRLDDSLVALHLGQVKAAREILSSPFMDYAKSLIRHPMFLIDLSLTESLVRWHEEGPTAVGQDLRSTLAIKPIRPLARPAFTAIDTKIVLGDHARALGEMDSMRAHLRVASRRTCSALQSAEIALVEAVASGKRRQLIDLRDEAVRRGFGLIAKCCEAALAWERDELAPEGLLFRPELPLAGTY